MGALYIVNECKNCSHEKICCEQGKYKEFLELIKNLHNPRDERMNLKDYYEASVKVGCIYFEPRLGHAKYSYEGSLKKG